ncbi:hypothetical protein [Paenibacillus sp. NPDC057967]|uniref:hypothetical protein n=1 Tax=Paenibacillus sp. NPDC057967 TaxID=3346293 RepID=UPI0036D84348
MKEALLKQLREFGADLSQHEHHQYMPKLRDFLVPYLLKEKAYVADIDTLFRHEFTRNDVVRSTEYYILSNPNVRSKSAIDDFLIALNRLFEELINERYPNQNLRNIQPFTKLSQEIEGRPDVLSRQLKAREANPPIDEDQFRFLYSELNSRTKETPIAMQVKLILKLLLLYGFKFNRIVELSLGDFDHERRLLNIQCDKCPDGEIKLELPYSLFQCLKRHYEQRIKVETTYSNLFLTSTNKPITNAFITTMLNKVKEKYYSRREVETLTKNPFTATGLSKFAIINMILQGLNQTSIIDVTGVEYDIYQNCQDHVNELLSEDYNRHINYKIRAIKAYDIL